MLAFDDWQRAVRLSLPLDEMRVVTREAPLLRDLLIVDCPDPDTTEEAEGLGLSAKGQSDVHSSVPQPLALGPQPTTNLARLHRIHRRLNDLGRSIEIWSSLTKIERIVL